MENLKFFDLNMRNFLLPIVKESDSDYYVSLKEELNKYNSYIKSLDYFSDTLKHEIEKNIELVMKSIEYYYNAQFENAKKCIYKILEGYMNNKFIVSDIDESYIFNNWRDSKTNTYMLYDWRDIKPIGLFRARESVQNLLAKDMLHIPLSKRGLVSTQRFSMAGIPCIYLATSTYCCWLELNMPSQHTLYASSIKLPQNTRVLNLAISSNFVNNISVCKDENDIAFLEEILGIWPLICATSFNILEKNRSFKSEYIVSQLIMQCLSELKIDAIAYFSKKLNDLTVYPHAINVAIPVQKDFKQNNEYWLNSGKTFLTNPVCYNDFIEEFGYNVPTAMQPLFNIDNYIEVLGNPVDFDTLKFSKFDQYLVRMTHDKFSDVL